ncbi:MAG: mitochondrial fission ELM1 family protein, partial [Alphaproteobacteria bacterium]|nr:mitochondrial fission ELM1 family protein [Alphaproteobacteria bacterium]
MTRHTWVLTEPKSGMVNQALGLAEAIGYPCALKTLRPTAPWRWLPPGLWRAGVFGVAPGEDGAPPLAPPWPDLTISCGRRSVGPALAVKRASGGRTFAIHIQYPRTRIDRFDAIIAPEHDGLVGPNVLTTRGSVSHVTTAKLADGAARFGAGLAHMPRPLVGVLVGGPNNVFAFDAPDAALLARDLATLARASGAGLAVTVSRRTGPAAVEALRRGLEGLPVAYWDGRGDNPYFGYLALADAFVVTGDSVNMVTEACATGKPVHVVA